jgi:hypothetical protein
MTQGPAGLAASRLNQLAVLRLNMQDNCQPDLLLMIDSRTALTTDSTSALTRSTSL